MDPKNNLSENHRGELLKVGMSPIVRWNLIILLYPTNMVAD